MPKAFTALHKTVLSPADGYDHMVINQSHIAINEILDRVTLVQ